MAVELRGGRLHWSGSRDAEGYREYKITWQIACDKDDGPAAALNCPGLPLPGSQWAFANDSDPFVWCRPDAQVDPVLEDREPNTFFLVTQTFSNKPPSKNTRGCQDNPIEDPLLEPQKVSGGSNKFTEEAYRDRFGLPILSSSHEQIRGPQVEFDANKETVTVEQNVALLQRELWGPMRNCVNDAELWGAARRCVKLADVNWEKVYYGLCGYYYKRRFTFEINDQTHDRDLLDEGTKVLNGHWDESTGAWILDDIPTQGEPSRFNPNHFIKFTDRSGNACRVVLDGTGLPSDVITSSNRLFLSVANANTGNAVSAPAFWIPLAADAQSTPSADFWEEFRKFRRGEIVQWSGNDYVALRENFGADPTTSTDDWLSLGVTPVTYTNQGVYNAATAYSKGDYVSALLSGKGAGYIHVEKYPEANFLLLGIPTSL